MAAIDHKVRTLVKIEQLVRLIRSKGVGVYFVTQNPLDVPDKVLAQLGNRVQHALRAFTARDQKAAIVRDFIARKSRAQLIPITESDAGAVLEEGSDVVELVCRRQELALLTETKRPVTAVAREPSSVVRIPRQLFLKTLEGYPDAALRMRDALASRVSRTTGEFARVRSVLAGGAPLRK